MMLSSLLINMAEILSCANPFDYGDGPIFDDDDDNQDDDVCISDISLDIDPITEAMILKKLSSTSDSIEVFSNNCNQSISNKSNYEKKEREALEFNQQNLESIEPLLVTSERFKDDHSAIKEIRDHLIKASEDILNSNIQKQSLTNDSENTIDSSNEYINFCFDIMSGELNDSENLRNHLEFSLLSFNEIINNDEKVNSKNKLKIESDTPVQTKPNLKPRKQVASKNMALLKSLYKNISLSESEEEVDVVTVDRNLNYHDLFKEETEAENNLSMKNTYFDDEKLNESKIKPTEKEFEKKSEIVQQEEKSNQKLINIQDQTNKKTKKIFKNVFNNNQDQKKMKSNQQKQRQNQKPKNLPKIYKNVIKECKKQNRMFLKSENMNSNQNKDHQKQNKKYEQVVVSQKKQIQNTVIQQEVHSQKKQVQNTVIQQQKDNITIFESEQNDECISEIMPLKKKEIQDVVPQIKSRLCSRLLAKRKYEQLNSSKEPKTDEVSLNINQDKNPNDVNLSEYQELIKKCPLISNDIELLGNEVYPRTFQNKKLNIKLLEQQKIQDYTLEKLKSTSKSLVSQQNSSIKQALNKFTNNIQQNTIKNNNQQKNVKNNDSNKIHDLNKHFTNINAYHFLLDHSYCKHPEDNFAGMSPNIIENYKTDQVTSSRKSENESSNISLKSNVGSNIMKNNLDSISLHKSSEINNANEVPNNKSAKNETIDDMPENKDDSIQFHNYSVKYDHQELSMGKKITAAFNISQHINKEVKKDSIDNNSKEQSSISTSKTALSTVSSKVKIEQINERHQKNTDAKKLISGENCTKIFQNLCNSQKTEVQKHSSLSNIILKQCPRLNNDTSKACMQNLFTKENSNCKTIPNISTKDSKCPKILGILDNMPISPKRRKHNSWSSSSSSICSSRSHSRSPSPSYYTKHKSHQYSRNTSCQKHPLRSSRSPSCSSRSDYSESSPYSYEDYSKELHSSLRKYSHSKSRSHYSRHRSSHLQKKSDDKRREHEEEKIRQAEERRVVYVGNLPDDMNRSELQSHFIKYGVIENVKVYPGREKNYGFVTFKFRSDAYKAIEEGPKDPFLSKFEINFGSRRTFCKQVYKDLDAHSKMKEREKNMDFEELLASYQRARRKQHFEDH